MSSVKYSPYYYNKLKAESPDLIARIERDILKGHTANTIANDHHNHDTVLWTFIISAARYLIQQGVEK